jgi:acyl carrier protein
MDNKEKLVDAFAQALNIDKSKINDDLKYQGIEQWDSIAHMVLIGQIEEAFDISLETDDVLDLSSFGKAREIVSKYGVKL